MQKRCPVCGGVSAVEHPFSDIILYRCPTCDHCFTDIKVIDNKVIYDENYYLDNHKNWFNNPNIVLFRRIHNVILSNIQNPSIIDVGCGKGDLLRFLSAENPGMNLTGIDFSPNDDVEGIKFLQGDFLSFEPDKKYDIVISLAVIEHIAEPHVYIKALKNMCKSGGLIIIMTLNDRSILYCLARVLKRVGIDGPCKRLYGKHHVNHYNRASLNKLLDLNGLVNVQTLNHDIPFKAIDTGVVWYPLDIIVRACTMVAFWCGRLTGRTYLQTVICKKID